MAFSQTITSFFTPNSSHWLKINSTVLATKKTEVHFSTGQNSIKIGNKFGWCYWFWRQKKD
jgi:hypothetical protein